MSNDRSRPSRGLNDGYRYHGITGLSPLTHPQQPAFPTSWQARCVAQGLPLAQGEWFWSNIERVVAGSELVTLDCLQYGSDGLTSSLGVGAGGPEVVYQRRGESAGEPLAAGAHGWLWHVAIVKAFRAAGANVGPIF